jgi:resuscitation-promoting factor RpfA
MPVRPVRAALQPLLLALLLIASLAAFALPAQAHTWRTRWDCMAHYESTNRWHINTGNGHYGGLQFSLSTWRYYGGPGYSGNAYPHRATRGEQIRVAKRVAWRGWAGRAPQGGSAAWPNTWPRCH